MPPEPFQRAPCPACGTFDYDCIPHLMALDCYTCRKLVPLKYDEQTEQQDQERWQKGPEPCHSNPKDHAHAATLTSSSASLTL